MPKKSVLPFTFNKEYGIIIMPKEFDESKVKRDRLGRFAEMSSKEISDAIRQEIGGHLYIPAVNGNVSRNALTSNQWRLWYKEQTQREKSYLIGEIGERRFVNVEGIYVLTTGSFDKPEVEAIYKFSGLIVQREMDKLLEIKYGRKD